MDRQKTVEETPIPDDQLLTDLSTRLGELLLLGGKQVASAESCTGGWIAKVLTDVAGSSGWFEGGVVAYSNRIKTEVLGVSPAVLNGDGAVSQSVVEAMASGVCSLVDSDLAVAVSGVAGPGGGNDDKPVGMVWIGWHDRERQWSHCHQFDGDRDAVRRLTVQAALEGLIRALVDDSTTG